MMPTKQQADHAMTMWCAHAPSPTYGLSALTDTLMSMDASRIMTAEPAGFRGTTTRNIPPEPARSTTNKGWDNLQCGTNTELDFKDIKFNYFAFSSYGVSSLALNLATNLAPILAPNPNSSPAPAPNQPSEDQTRSPPSTRIPLHTTGVSGTISRGIYISPGTPCADINTDAPKVQVGSTTGQIQK